MQPFDIERSGAGLPAGHRMRRITLAAAMLGTALALGGLYTAWHALILPPATFPKETLISIPEDASVGEMAVVLRDAGAIRSPFLFRAYARVTFQDRDLASGYYIFERPLGLVRLVQRMAQGEHGIEPFRVTLTEGMTVDDMAGELSRGIPGFDSEAFKTQASTSEGYLFPDTYFFMPGTTADDAYLRLRDHFNDQVAMLDEELETFGKPLEDVVIMASLLEREAQSEEDMRIIAGILWKRRAIEMPLQVDAPFGYIRGENGYEPTAADLATDSPYNTYLNPGLPPTPISNPGLKAIRATITPITTDYLYYLTGTDGLMRYGRTFEEHKKNRELYLD
jgi:UPF0755 protein